MNSLPLDPGMLMYLGFGLFLALMFRFVFRMKQEDTKEYKRGNSLPLSVWLICIFAWPLIVLIAVMKPEAFNDTRL